MALFRTACEAMKRLDPNFQNAAREASKDTPMLPRDVLMAALYGRGPVVYLTNGERLVPMPRRIEMSEMLDNLSYTPGAMMFRGPYAWEGIQPGLTGQVLSYREGGASPQWVTPQSGPNVFSTRLRRKTQAAALSSWPQAVPWQAVDWDENSIWAPQAPDRIHIPLGMSRMRWGAFLRLVGPNAEAETFAGLVAGASTSYLRELGVMAFTNIAAGFSNREYMITSEWAPVPNAEYVRLLINQTPASAQAFGDSCWINVEFMKA